MTETLTFSDVPSFDTWYTGEWTTLSVHTGSWITSTAWPTAKMITYMPFSMPSSMTVVQMGWMNGATVNAGNLVQAGIYNAAWALVGSCTATAQGTASTLQVVTPTAFTLYGNTQYYAALTCDLAAGAGTSTFGCMAAGGIGQVACCGVLGETPGTFGLPGTATAIAPTSEVLSSIVLSSVTTL